MRVGALFSGGKDSTYAAWEASKNDQLACLITVFPDSDSSYMFHFPDLSWTALQAQAMDVPQVTEKSPGVKEEELSDLRRAISRAKSLYGLEGIYTGALASVYQKSRVETICQELGLQCVSPLWGIDPEVHLRRLLASHFEVMVVSVSALGLEEKWLGRILDTLGVSELIDLGNKFKFNVGLEGGEGETFVLDCPLFSSRIEVTSSEKHWKGDSGVFEITWARLQEKRGNKLAPGFPQ